MSFVAFKADREHMKIKLFYIILIVALLACSKEEEPKSPANLISAVWHLRTIHHGVTDIMEDVPVTLNGMNVIFSDSAKLHATSSCNVFDGEYSVHGSDSLIIFNLGTTKMYCQDATVRYWESLCFDGFQNTVKYRIVDGKLILIAKNGDEMIFISS
jgi:heat shock protein HslJ